MAWAIGDADQATVRERLRRAGTAASCANGCVVRERLRRAGTGDRWHTPAVARISSRA
jgi:hypothetical protein